MAGNSLGKLFAAITACAVFFIYPTLDTAQQMDNRSQTYVMNKTTRFVDSVKNCGYLNDEMMDRFGEELSATGNLYGIRIVHDHKVYVPVYDDTDTFTGKTELVYQDTYEDDILDEIYNGSGKYEFTEGDFISVTVVSKSLTIFQKLNNIINGVSSDSPAILANYGGMIRDDEN